ncbi:hypothetical protein [Rhizobium leguminosarum]|uniref:hypothetical protein n=1 Tax=Rhizobium leguminosarum TaxID=384 RepID=UPI001FEEDC36|nr:hypothetical protein [Rhizobium leguminosarum]
MSSSILADTEAYRTLEQNLKKMGFERAQNDKGNKVNWRWQTMTEHGILVILEFLADDPKLRGGALQELPTEGNVSAVNIPHASLVFGHHDRMEVTADLLGEKGRSTESIPYADIVHSHASRRLPLITGVSAKMRTISSTASNTEKAGSPAQSPNSKRL